MKAGGAVLVLVASAAAGAPVWAQDRPARGRLELGGGLAWSDGRSAGNATATLTENPAGGRFTLFDTATRVDPVAGFAVRLAARVWGPAVLEAGFERYHPDVRTTVSRDAEGGGGEVTGELGSSIVEGSLRLDVEKLSFLRSRVVPFVLGGGGYLEETEAGYQRTGRVFHAGAGVQGRAFAGRGLLKGVGLRLEGRVTWRKKGFDLADRTQRLGVAAASVYFVL